MNLNHLTRRRTAAIITLLALSSTHAAHATSGVWSKNGGGLWSNAGNWLQNSIADGPGETADFAFIDITVDSVVHLDSPRSLSTIDIGDDGPPTNNWRFDNNGNPNNILTLASSGGTAFITVDNQSATFDLTLAGDAGLFKNGFGNLIINQPATFTGRSELFLGTITVGVDNALPATTALTVDIDGLLDLNGHNQQLTGIAGIGTITNFSDAPATLTISTDLNLFVPTFITGNLSFIFTGGGILTLQTPANYTGGTIIGQGTLISAVDDALPFNTRLFVSEGATFDLHGHSQQVVTLDGGGTVTNSSATPSTFTIFANTNFISQTLLTGNLSLTFTGGGTLTLQTPATYTGGTIIGQGMLISAVDNALPITTRLFISQGATFDLHGNSQEVVTLDGGGTVTNSSPIPSTFTISTNSALISQTLLTGNLSFNFTGGGNLTLAAPATYTGDTTIESGNLFFNANGSSIGRVTGNGSLIVSTQRDLTTGSLFVHNVLIQDAARLTVRPSGGVGGGGGGGEGTSVITTLSLAGSPNNWTSKLDLTNNSLIVVNGANIPNQLKQAANLGSWNGTGGISSNAAQAAATTSTATALAYATGAQLTANTGHTQISGQTFNPTDTLILYTLAGDANMDQSVTFADFLQIQNHFNQSNTDWQGGDFNYDGATTFADFLILQNNFNKTLATEDGGGVNSLRPSSATAVPEPATLPLLALALSFLLRGRRRP